MNKDTLKSNTNETSQAIAVQALTFLARDAARLERFLSATGIGPETLRNAVAQREFQAGVIAYLLQDESLLLVFAAETGISPEAVAQAHLNLDQTGLGRS